MSLMDKTSRWFTDSSVKLAIACFAFTVILDLSLRLKPQTSEVKDAFVGGTHDVFTRRTPSPQWTVWYNDLKALEAAEVLKAREADQKAKADAKAKKEALEKSLEVKAAQQQGNVGGLRIGGLEYRLWGVFNKGSKPADADVFAVLDSKAGAALQVRVGDVVGTYRLVDITSRSVTFESNQEDRELTLWLFGKGPR
jgi:hypothetical protein